MSVQDEHENKARCEQSEKPRTRAEAFALAREAQKQKMKERASAAKKAYMARPDVQAKVALQKQKLKDQRKARSAAIKSAKKSEKTALAESKSNARECRQRERDLELASMLESASSLRNQSKASLESPTLDRIERPMLTVISGGRSSQS
jgi:hypothetical protein